MAGNEIDGYSTVQVAKMIGIAQPHLQRAIREGRVKAPPLHEFAGMKVRLWTAEQVEAARKALGKKRRRKAKR